MINWEKADDVFVQSIEIGIVVSEDSYIDNQINNLYTKDDLLDMVAIINQFIPINTHFYTKVIQTDTEPIPALIREWKSKDATLRVYIANNEDGSGYAILYGDKHSFFILGVNNCHPFVMTPKFEHYNSDGSCFDMIEPDISLLDLKSYACDKIVEYILDQTH